MMKDYGEGVGFFRIEKSENQCWLVTPEGKPFFSIGLNHMDSASLRYSDNIHIWKNNHWDQFSWIREKLIPDLKSWEFNTIGWVQESVVRSKEMNRHSRNWTYEEYRAADMPYCHMLPFAQIHQWDVETRFPDVFSEGFAEWCDYVARDMCTVMADDPNLIGYFFSDCPNWIHPSNNPLQKGPWFDPERLKDSSGREEFESMLEQYYKVTCEAVRRYDKNHLILGDRLEGKRPIPDEVISISSRYVDVLSIQYFDLPEKVIPEFQRWHKMTGKPVLLADCRLGIPSLDMSQKEKVKQYEDMMESLILQPFVIGWHLCGAYLRNHVRKFGLLDHFNNPFPELVQGISKVNRSIHERIQRN